MSQAPTGLHGCPDIQAELDSYFETCDASLLPDPAPLNEFLWSSINRSGIQQVLTPSSNKIRTLILRYDQRLTEDQVDEVDSCTPTCTATTKRGDLTAEYTIDTCDKLRIEELMTANDFKEACRDNIDILNKKLRLMMNALLAKIATKMTGLAVGLYGAWPTIAGTAVASELILATKKTGSTDINPEAIWDLDFAFKAANYCRGAAVFSGQQFYKYASLMQSGCCANQGIDLGDLMSRFGMAVAWDRRLQLELGADKALAIAPGALQPVYYVSGNDGIKNALPTYGANYSKEVIFIPGTNIPVDLTISDNCGNVSIIMETVVDLKALPQDMFAPGDYLEGVTFVNKIKVVNT